MIQIQCHCGNIRLRFHTEQSPAELPQRRCLCGFCASHGAVYTSDRNGRVEIEVKDAKLVSRYRNPDSISAHTMFFLVCSVCGVPPIAVSEIDGKEYAVINIRRGCTPRIELDQVADMDFDSEALEPRLERRKATWIPEVSWSEE